MDSLEMDLIKDKLGLEKLNIREEERNENEIRDLLIKDLQFNLKKIRTEIFEVSQDEFSRMLGMSKPTIVKYERNVDNLMSYKDYLIICTCIEYEYNKLIQEKNKKCIRLCELIIPEYINLVNNYFKSKSPFPFVAYFQLSQIKICRRFLDTFTYEKNIDPRDLGKRFPNLPIVIICSFDKVYDQLLKMIKVAKKIEDAQNKTGNIYIEDGSINKICLNIKENIYDIDKIYDSNKLIKKISTEINMNNIKQVDLSERYKAEKSGINIENGFLLITNSSKFEYSKPVTSSPILLELLLVIDKYDILSNNPLYWRYSNENKIEYYFNDDGKITKRIPWNIASLYHKKNNDINSMRTIQRKDYEGEILIVMKELLTYLNGSILIDDNEKEDIYKEIKARIERIMVMYERNMSNTFKDNVSKILKKYISI